MQQVVRQIIKENNVIKEPNIYTLLVDGNSLMKRNMVSNTVNKKGEPYRNGCSIAICN